VRFSSSHTCVDLFHDLFISFFLLVSLVELLQYVEQQRERVMHSVSCFFLDETVILIV
jgi:hypothetical protein